MFHQTRVPLRTWLRAAWLVCTQPRGVSARRLQHELGLGSYQTAWLLLQRLRHAIMHLSDAPFAGAVEVGVVHLGRPASKSGAMAPVVLIIVEYQRQRPGCIKLWHMPAANDANLRGFVRLSVAPGSRILTAAGATYGGLAAAGYQPVITPPAGGAPAAARTGRQVPRVAARLRRWLWTAHRGAIKRKNLQGYLDTFALGYNRRCTGPDGKRFRRLLAHMVRIRGRIYRQMTAATDAG